MSEPRSPRLKFSELITRHLQCFETKGMKLVDLAQVIGISERGLRQWKQKTNNPSCDNVWKFAELLNLRVEDRNELLSFASCSRRCSIEKQEDKNFVCYKQRSVIRPHLQIPYEEHIVPITTRCIKQPHQFFGRTAEVKRIFSHWKNNALEHVAVIGDKFGGKTSLLHYLKEIHVTQSDCLRDGQRNDWLKDKAADKWNWIYVDFAEQPEFRQLDTLLSYFEKQLGLPIVNGCKNNHLSQFIQEVKDKLSKTTVFLLDNIDVAYLRSELDEPFWNGMRGLGNDCGGKIGFCVTSRCKPAELREETKKLGKDSPFFNGFTEIELEPFTESEALELLSYVTPPLSPEKTLEILEKSQCQPKKLQMLCEEYLAYLE